MVTVLWVVSDLLSTRLKSLHTHKQPSRCAEASMPFICGNNPSALGLEVTFPYIGVITPVAFPKVVLIR